MAIRRRSCLCGSDSICKIHSKYKMLIIVKDEFKEHYKKWELVWFNFLQHQGKQEYDVYLGMKERIIKKFGTHPKMIIFYYNTDAENNEIRRENL